MRRWQLCKQNKLCFQLHYVQGLNQINGPINCGLWNEGKKKGQNQLCFVKLGKKRKGKTNGDEGNCKEKSRTKQL